jgi:dephospho-CoA kinase
MIPLPPTDEEPRPRLRWKHGSVPVFGLIGGIGAGKSAAARLLADRGATIIDADAVGHELLEDPAIRARIVERFGAGVLEPEPGSSTAGESTGQGPRISRRALGAVVFAEDRALRDLESILHPAMRDRFRRVIEHVARDGRSLCVVLDAAVLLEAGWDDLCDLVIFVEAPRPDRLRRVARSRGWSESTLDARERSQWSLFRKGQRADWVINNHGDMDRLGRELDRILARLRTTEVLPEAWSSARAQDAPVPAGLVPGSPARMGRTS